MTLRRLCTLLLSLVMMITAVPSHPAQTHAQGNSRTFPETGKTLGGKFLQYWDGHGGLAQQGYPISSEMQETSDTNGKIYTVQYMERAVFELHPENKAPNDVLLQLLGVFLYNQKYPKGAPDEAPNNEPGSRLFSETGQRLGGVFLQYWQTHGGLPQQGFPISDEFMEKSDLDGKTYRVQYFERAVFELHPENKAPFNVLLSQLGTFRYRAKYASVVQQVNGNGNQRPTPAFALKKGLAIFQSVRASEDGYFYIVAHDASDQDIGTVASLKGPGDVSVPVFLQADGMYKLDVQSEGAWTVNITQPKATYAPPPAKQEWRGHGWQASPLFSLKAGTARLHAVSPNDKAESTESISRVDLLDQDGTSIGSFAEGMRAIDASAEIAVPKDGVYILRIYFMNADWTVSVEQ